MTMPRREVALTFVCILITCAAAAMTAFDLARVGRSIGGDHPLELAELCIFGAIVVGLVYGGLVYQSCRAGHFWRLRRRDTAPRDALERIYDAPARPLAVLIPSYKEELDVLAQTTLSAAFMEYPNRRIVVLLDDPPNGSAKDMEALASSRRLIRNLDATFAAAAQPFIQELQSFLRRRPTAHAAGEARRLSELYRRAAWWVDGFGARFADSRAPADRFFTESVLRRSSSQHRERAQALLSCPLGLEQIEREYRRLAALFSVRIESFERKRHADLSHAPNKAMNLNAYIGLIGGAYRETPSDEGRRLTPCAAAVADLVAPAADYLLTLDADSMVLSDYALQLVAIMEADARIAVAQTPYSAFPGAPGALERIAGATTDMQYVVHQGFTAFDATYWVGANALLRHAALIDIRTFESERGRKMPVFIQDRTVIEDTGSTVDLIRRGWRLHNHSQRLAYSATPPDFGSLVIQRHRWSNGGLIILPDLLRYCFGRQGARPTLGEALLRIHYLASPTISSFGLLALLLLRFDSRFDSWWLPLSAAPYYFVYGRDLKQNGYRVADLISVYALNLLLLPVTLAGVLASIRQIATGKKAAFARTPKIEDRTATPPAFISFSLAAILYMGGVSAFDALGGRWAQAVFAGLNGVLFAYGHTLFMGWRASVADVVASFAPDRRADPAALAETAPADDLVEEPVTASAAA